jgi:hypothetical protein
VNYAIYFGIFATFVLLGGGEKLAMLDKRQRGYEFKRRARRAFIPYTILGYRWRFPVNK